MERQSISCFDFCGGSLQVVDLLDARSRAQLVQCGKAARAVVERIWRDWDQLLQAVDGDHLEGTLVQLEIVLQHVVPN